MYTGGAIGIVGVAFLPVPQLHSNVSGSFFVVKTEGWSSPGHSSA